MKRAAKWNSRRRKMNPALSMNTRQIKANLARARITRKIGRSINKPAEAINVEIGDHYRYSKMDYFNAAQMFGEALINLLRLENVVRTSLTDDIHPTKKRGRKRVDERKFNRWINLKGTRIRTLRESSARRTYNELKKLFNWTEEGQCRHFDAILYIRKLGLEREVANKLAKSYKVPAEKIFDAFSHLPEIPKASKAYVILPSRDENGRRMSAQQKQAKEVLRTVFEIEQKDIDNKIHSVYYDAKTLSKIASEFVSVRRSAALYRGKLPPEKQTQLVYRTLTFGRSNIADLQQAQRFLENKRNTRLTRKNNSIKLVSFQKLAFLLGDFPARKEIFQRGEMLGLGSFHASLIKTINSLNSEIRFKQKSGEINAREIASEKIFNSVLAEAKNALNYSLQLMNCQSLAA